MTEEIKLSPREQEILQLVATGLTNREIAQALTISPNTVKVHLSNIFEKTGVASRTEATLYGIEHGIVDVPGGEVSAPPEPFSFWDAIMKYRWIWIGVLLLLIVFGVLLATDILAPEPTPGASALGDIEERWQELKPLPEPRAAMAVVDYDGMIYAIAGEGPDGVEDAVFRYSPEDAHWKKLSDKPTPVADVQGALIGEKIYVPGGRLATGKPTDALEIYDPRQDKWTQGASLPKSISAYALVDFEGKLYLFGGWDGERALADVYAYDPGEDVWREGTKMDIARQDAGAVALSDKIVVLGGKNTAGSLKDAVAYFPSRDSGADDPWEPFVDLPVENYDFGVASIYDSIYIIGGMSGDAADENQAWVLTEENWVSFPTAQDFLGQPTTLAAQGSLLVLLNSKAPLTQTQVWTYQAFYYSIYIPIVQ